MAVPRPSLESMASSAESSLLFPATARARRKDPALHQTLLCAMGPSISSTPRSRWVPFPLPGACRRRRCAMNGLFNALYARIRRLSTDVRTAGTAASSRTKQKTSTDGACSWRAHRQPFQTFFLLPPPAANGCQAGSLCGWPASRPGREDSEAADTAVCSLLDAPNIDEAPRSREARRALTVHRALCIGARAALGGWPNSIYIFRSHDKSGLQAPLCGLSKGSGCGAADTSTKPNCRPFISPRRRTSFVDDSCLLLTGHGSLTWPHTVRWTGCGPSCHLCRPWPHRKLQRRS